MRGMSAPTDLHGLSHVVLDCRQPLLDIPSGLEVSSKRHTFSLHAVHGKNVVALWIRPEIQTYNSIKALLQVGMDSLRTRGVFATTSTSKKHPGGKKTPRADSREFSLCTSRPGGFSSG